MSESEEIEPGSRLWITVLAGVAIGAVIGLSTAMLVGSDAGAPDPAAPAPTSTVPDDQNDVGRRFLDAWLRWRSITVRVDYEFSRERPDGDRLETTDVVIQRGDDRLTARFGTVNGIVAGQSVRCVSADDGTADCVRTPVERSADEQRRVELENWADHLSGQPPYYRISQLDDGCFELVLTRNIPTAEYGRVADFCFDASSGALVETSTTFESGLVERRVAVRITTDVGPADFELVEGGRLD